MVGGENVAGWDGVCMSLELYKSMWSRFFSRTEQTGQKTKLESRRAGEQESRNVE